MKTNTASENRHVEYLPDILIPHYLRCSGARIFPRYWTLTFRSGRTWFWSTVRALTWTRTWSRSWIIGPTITIVRSGPTVTTEKYNQLLHILEYIQLETKTMTNLIPSAPIVASTASVSRGCRTTISCHLNSQFPAIQYSSIHSIQRIFGISFIIKSIEYVIFFELQ